MPGKAKNMNNETTSKQESALPADFDGVFRFTNFSNEDFTARWDNIAYTFPKLKQSPMIIPNATPEQVQTIRKKFAKELATREFYKTPKFAQMDDRSHGQNPAIYTDSDLIPLIQKCLDPLPVEQAKVVVLPKQDERIFSRDTDGNLTVKVIDGNPNNPSSKKSLFPDSAGSL